MSLEYFSQPEMPPNHFTEMGESVGLGESAAARCLLEDLEDRQLGGRIGEPIAGREVISGHTEDGYIRGLYACDGCGAQCVLTHDSKWRIKLNERPASGPQLGDCPNIAEQ